MTNQNDTQTAPLPTPGAGAAMMHLAVNSIARSLTNPRKHFDPAKLQELADSIAATGVHQPILVRPLPAHRVADEQAWAKAEKRPRAEYELIAGERRWRATQLAGLEQIPAMIRDMTDAQALEAQVIENLQREDISKLEEAEGYRALMIEADMNADEIGAKVGKGKSRAYIYSVLKILDLCDEGKDALRQGELDFSSALAIARIATADLQREALEWATDADYQGDKPTAREVQQHVKRNYTLDLRKAPFNRDDADLCPAAGACTHCPHRTGAGQGEDAKGADVCTNPPCYHAKGQASAEQQRKKAQESGCEVLDEKQAQQLIGNFYSDFQGVPGFKRLDSPRDCPIEGTTLRKAIGVKIMEQSGIKPTLITNPDKPTELIHCVTPEQARQLLQMAGHTEGEEKLIAETKERNRLDAEAARKQAGDDYERAWRMEVLQEIVKRLQQKERNQHARPIALPESYAINRLAALRLAGQLNGDDAKLLCKLLDLGKVAPKEAIKQAASEWQRPELLTGCIIALHDRGWREIYDYGTGNWEHHKNPELLAIADALAIDVAVVQAKAQANVRATEAEKPDDSAAQKPDLPLDPAAPTDQGAGKGKAKTGTGGKNRRAPAARAGGGGEKLTAQAASAGIAAALQALTGEPDPGAAAAAQGDDAGAVAAGASQPQGPLVTLKRKKTITPPADTPAVAPEGDTGEPIANAVADDEWPPALGTRVRIVQATPGSKQERWVGQEGKVSRHAQNKRIDVTFYKDGSAVPVILLFFQHQVEVLP